MSALPVLAASTLGALAAAVERGALVAPFGAMQVARHVPLAEQADALRLVETLHAAGLGGAGMAAALRLAETSRLAGDGKPQPSLVWSDLDIAGSRDTAVVCNELFREARRSVVVSTFNLGHKTRPGEAKGNPVLLPLAKRMSETEGLTVRLFVNLRRLPQMAHASTREVEDAFVHWFRQEIWPWEYVPEVYYDPRSLEARDEESACLHAKCVVVDDARAFVTSANLTEAAQVSPPTRIGPTSTEITDAHEPTGGVLGGSRPSASLGVVRTRRRPACRRRARVGDARRFGIRSGVSDLDTSSHP